MLHFALSVVIILWASACYAKDKISNLSLRALSEIKVYTASRKEEDPERSPSAIYVITQEDIKQMGAQTIPDALRAAPGIHVAKISSNKWVIASRGFSGQYVTNLLVLLDGRPLYSTLFSGVFWDQQDLVMEDIKQIEVIRGPGAAVWGLNAVNGVINIITKHSEDTQGTYLSLTSGNYFNAITEARKGGKLDDKSSYRAYVKYRNTDNYKKLDGTSNNDDWQMANAGFRYDADFSYNNSLELTGQIRTSEANQNLKLPTLAAPFFLRDADDEVVHGGYLMANWQRGLSERSDLRTKAYVDLSKIDLGYVAIVNRVFEVEAQNDYQLSDRHSLIWGAGYRLVSDAIDDSIYLNYDPQSRITNFASIFAQDTIALIENELYATLGSKIEYNSYSGVEVLPSTKLAWTFSENQTLWGSVSRAARSPSRGTHDLSLQSLGTPAGYVSLIGNDAFQAEELLAYELGYKNAVFHSLSFDISAFINDYSKLRTFTSGRPPFGAVAVPLDIANNGAAHNIGYEINAKYKPSSQWWLTASYSYIRPNYQLNSGVADPIFTNEEQRTPSNIASLRGSYQLTPSLTTNHSLYYLDKLESFQIGKQLNYSANILFTPVPGTEIGLYAENILEDQHREFSAPLYGEPAWVPRAYFIKISVGL